MPEPDTRRTRAIWGACFTALFAANLLLHKPVSDFCDAMYARFGFTAYNKVALIAFSILGLVVLIALLVRRRRSLFQPRAVAILLTLASLSAASQHWLLVANVELIHFPQYALLTACLLGAGFSPQAAWLTGTLSGVVDEVYQHVMIYAGRPDTYLDYNDMVLNALGSAWTVALLCPASPSTRQASAVNFGRRAARAGIGIAATVAVVWLDPPHVRPILQSAATGKLYHVMAASEAVMAGLLIWLLLRQMPASRGDR